MNQQPGFEIMPFEIAPQFEGESYEDEYNEGEYQEREYQEKEYEYEGEYQEGEYEYETPPRRAPDCKLPAPRLVTDFSGPAAECVASLRRAGKTRAQALAIINERIGVAIRMLHKAAVDLRYDKRAAPTKDLFLKIFRVRPEFVPTWLKPTATIKDRGDVVATRCCRVAQLLASGRIKFFCAINGTNCPDCAASEPSNHACSSFGNHVVVCLGTSFWDDMKAGRATSMLSTLMHEPFHIYFGRYVTEHRTTAGKFGGVNCILRFVFEANRRSAPARVNKACSDMAVRQELETAWS